MSNQYWIIRKRGKYLKSWSFATGLGHTFRWSTHFEEAHQFCDYSTTLGFAGGTKGTLQPHDISLSFAE